MDTAASLRRSRRAILGAALGATAATVASAIELPKVVSASSDGANVQIGGSYLDATTATEIKSLNADGYPAMSLRGSVGSGLWAGSDSSYGIEVSGAPGALIGTVFSPTGQAIVGMQYTSKANAPLNLPSGVIGATEGTDGAAGVRGLAVGDSSGTYGVLGSSASSSTAYGVYGLASAATTTSQGVGVYGHAKSSSGGVGTYGWAEAATGTTYGVIGQAQSPTGVGVYGYAPGGGVAVRATSTGGVALETSGRIVAHKASGVATILKGTTSVTVRPAIAVTSSAFVLLTPRGNLGSRGLWSTLSVSAGSITIRVSSAVSGPVQVGWLLVG